MGNIVLNLTKPGETGTKLSLNLNKGESFEAHLSWAGDTDIDLHAIHSVNYGGTGAKASSIEDILSTYNVIREENGGTVGSLQKSSDGSFNIHNGALVHSPDARNGALAGVDEWIKIDPTKLRGTADAVVDIPLIAMIHPQAGNRRFKNVQNAEVVIKNSTGKELLRVSLSDQFGDFVGVQMGSILIDEKGPAFHSVGKGFNGDFNSVLSHFS